MEAMEFQNAVEKESEPPLNEEAARLFTASERILQNYARARALTGADLKALIEDVLRNPEFNADDIDRNMMERLNKAIDDGEFEIFDMWKEGDGHQDVKLFSRNLEKVVRGFRPSMEGLKPGVILLILGQGHFAGACRRP